MRPVYVPEDSLTSDFYKFNGKVPEKFNKPGIKPSVYIPFFHVILKIKF